MAIKVRSFGKVRLLDLSGELRLAGGDLALHEAVSSLLAEGHIHVLLNLSQVPFIDTIGIAELVVSCKRARERGGEVKLLSPSPAVQRVLRTTRLDEVFEIYNDETEALGSF